MATSKDLTIGLIGMGEMGKMYAKTFERAGYKKCVFNGKGGDEGENKISNTLNHSILVSDRPDKTSALKAEFQGTAINVLEDGHLVSRLSDIIVYSVEVANIDKVVKEYARSTKRGAIVGGQCSVKYPEVLAFQQYLPEDVDIVTLHSLHGPKVDPKGQPLAIIPVRTTSQKSLTVMEDLLSCLRSKFVRLTAAEHDEVTADTQSVTHLAFLSMGTAWKESGAYPWESTSPYQSGIENVKINMTMRIYGNQWHVYAGLAILNPSAKQHIDRFARSTTEIFKMMIGQQEIELRQRLHDARDWVFGRQDDSSRVPILLDDKILNDFSLRKASVQPQEPRPNSHLSLLAMVDCWYHLRVKPFNHLEVAATPVFRLLLGAAEYLFRRDADRLDSAIHTACFDEAFRSDDLEFVIATREWNGVIQFGNFDLYKQKFEETCKFFESRFAEANELGSRMIVALLAA